MIKEAKSKKELLKEILARDKWRVKNYFKGVGHYHKRKDILRNIYEAIDQSILPKDFSLADLGCGPGQIAMYIYNKLKKKFNIKIYFVDINPLMLRKIPKRKNFVKLKEDITKLKKLPKNHFDIVIIKQVLDYLPKEQQKQTLNNVYKILKSNGQFILSAIISPSKELHNLTNYLYTERERIIKTKVKKFIPTKETYKRWLKKIGFKEVNERYTYFMPLSTKDFQFTFRLSKEKKEQLDNLYERVIKKDKQKLFNGRKIRNSYKLDEWAIILYARKKCS